MVLIISHNFHPTLALIPTDLPAYYMVVALLGNTSGVLNVTACVLAKAVAKDFFLILLDPELANYFVLHETLFLAHVGTSCFFFGFFGQTRANYKLNLLPSSAQK